MQAVATGLLERNVATLRYQFPYMEQRQARPDAPPRAHMTVRAAVEEAGRLAPGLPIFAGGKSFGARMTSQAQAVRPLDDVRGLVFFGFPLHPAGKPSDQRAEHLGDVHVPMLFLQGDRDRLAELSFVRQVTRPLGERVSLHVIEHADHSFHVPARSRTTDEAVMQKMLDTASSWIGALAPPHLTSAPHEQKGSL
jgi:predicted alpha/beta-hydrolase family hydrolase